MTPDNARTPAVAAILDLVRETGRSAHPEAGETVSTLVYAWSVLNGRNPVEVQREVEAYADALDADPADYDEGAEFPRQID